MFLLGNWSNYEELEDKLSMPELLLTLEAYRTRLKRDREFFAALQGIDISSSSENKIEEIRRNAHIKNSGGNPELNDIKDIRGPLAEAEGFGIGMGLGYETV